MREQSDVQTIINFHGIGAPTRAFEAGEEPYWISIDRFEEILRILSSKKYASKTRITFDDGNASDLDIAVPKLQAHGLSAQFFILSGRLGRSGYLSAANLHILQSEGMRIGSHGQNHVEWTSLSSADLSTEIVEARKRLQDLTGSPIDCVAIPFGKYNRRILREVRKASFQTVFTSDGGASRPTWWLQPRTSIRMDMNPRIIAKLIEFGIGTSRTMLRDVRIFVKKLR